MQWSLESGRAGDVDGRDAAARNDAGVWKDGSVVKVIGCSSRGSELGLQHPQQVAHNKLELQL